MDIEQIFAAEVLNARGNAKIANTAGIPQRTCDQVACALADLWDAGRDEGLTAAEIQTIANRYVDYDDDGEAWPRQIAENVVPFRR